MNYFDADDDGDAVMTTTTLMLMMRGKVSRTDNSDDDLADDSDVDEYEAMRAAGTINTGKDWMGSPGSTPQALYIMGRTGWGHRVAAARTVNDGEDWMGSPGGAPKVL